MAGQDIIKSLESLDFTNYEARVLYALVEGRIMSGSEVAKQSKVPRSSAYTILKQFAEKGICNEIQTTTVTQYELIDPKVVRDKIEKEIRDTFETKHSRLTDSFDKLQSVFRVKELESKKTDVELIKGFNRQRVSKFLHLMKSSKKEILLMNKLEGSVQNESNEAAIEFFKHGGVTKSIYEASYNFKIKIKGTWTNVDPEALVKLCENFAMQGEQIKLAPLVPQNMAIFDRKIVFFSLVDPLIPKDNRSDIIVKNEAFANFIVDSFNAAWEKADTIDVFKRKNNL